jgi:hypothetical protein
MRKLAGLLVMAGVLLLPVMATVAAATHDRLDVTGTVFPCRRSRRSARASGESTVSHHGCSPQRLWAWAMG